MASTMICTETIEARCRKLMAELAAMPSRGWDTERKRAEKRAEVDAALDEWAEAQASAESIHWIRVYGGEPVSIPVLVIDCVCDKGCVDVCKCP